MDDLRTHVYSQIRGRVCFLSKREVTGSPLCDTKGL